MAAVWPPRPNRSGALDNKVLSLQSRHSPAPGSFSMTRPSFSPGGIRPTSFAKQPRQRLGAVRRPASLNANQRVPSVVHGGPGVRIPQTGASLRRGEGCVSSRTRGARQGLVPLPPSLISRVPGSTGSLCAHKKIRKNKEPRPCDTYREHAGLSFVERDRGPTGPRGAWVRKETSARGDGRPHLATILNRSRGYCRAIAPASASRGRDVAKESTRHGPLGRGGGAGGRERREGAGHHLPHDPHPRAPGPLPLLHSVHHLRLLGDRAGESPAPGAPCAPPPSDGAPGPAPPPPTRRRRTRR